MIEERDIKYVNKDFTDFRGQLIEYTKNYFPDSYNDFSPASPGMMFMEMAAYVGDILSFYQDTQLQETYLTYAKDPKNLFSLAYMMGYTPKTTGVSEVEIEVSQIIDATGTNYAPNWNQAAIINANATITSTDSSQTDFIIPNTVDFTFSSSYDPTDIRIYALDSGNNPTSYIIKKKVKAFSSKIVTTTKVVGSSQKFLTHTISDTNIVGVLDITDSNSNIWYEVPVLGQDTIYTSTPNTGIDSKNTPYILTLQKAPRRFVTRMLSTGNMEIQFGAGTNLLDNSVLLPDPTNVGTGTILATKALDKAYDPSNFLHSNSYGLAPNNTTLTIRYLKGGGVSANVPANTVTLSSLANTISAAGGDTTRLTSEFLFFNNPNPAYGGRDGDTVEELKQNSMRAFSEQKRTVTLQDYSVRAASLPSKYGSIAKVYATQDSRSNTTSIVQNNPLAVSLYILAYDSLGKLVPASLTLKNNLKQYLSEYIMVTDTVTIKDAFIVNIGVNYDIISRPGYSSRDVLLNCNKALQDYMHTSKRSINESLNLSSIYTLLDKVKGVQTVQKVEITNKVGGKYSAIGYDTIGSTINNILYPSKDPCIFEVKYPETDIKGRVTVI